MNHYSYSPIPKYKKYTYYRLYQSERIKSSIIHYYIIQSMMFYSNSVVENMIWKSGSFYLRSLGMMFGFIVVSVNKFTNILIVGDVPVSKIEITYFPVIDRYMR